MKKSRILYAWIITILITLLTLIFAYKGSLPTPLEELLIGIEAVVIATLLLNELSKVLNEPTIIITPISKKSDVGFSVKVKDENIEDVEVYCNKVKIDLKDGNEEVIKDLHVGGIAFFYPFKIILSDEEFKDSASQWEYLDKTDKYQLRVTLSNEELTQLHVAHTRKDQIVCVSMTEDFIEYNKLSGTSRRDKRLFYRGWFPIPIGSFSGLEIKKPPWEFPQFHCNIRITGKGIKKEINCWYDFTCSFSFFRGPTTSRIEDVLVDCNFGKTKSLKC
ncbi:MAG: hypothetical protein ABSE15_00385 [Candidatus Bathyarchaeia archaeon]